MSKSEFIELRAAEGLSQTATTDKDGRFRLTGFGRERLVVLRIEGATIETRYAHVRTRAGDTILVVRDKHFPPFATTMAIHGATFDHAAAPTRPVVGTVTDRATGRISPLTAPAAISNSFGLPIQTKIQVEITIKTEMHQRSYFAISG